MELQNKLTDWANEPTVADLRKDFEVAKSYHDEQCGKIKHWVNLLNVEGECAPKKLKGRSSIQPKLIRKQAEWRYSALTVPFLSAPRVFQVKPRTFEDVEAAEQNELLLNYQMETQLNKTKFIKNLVRVTVNEGTAIVRTGWKNVTEPAIQQVPLYNEIPLDPNDPRPEIQQIAQQIQQATELKHSNPRGFKEQVPEEIQESVNATEEKGTPIYCEPTGSYQEVPYEKVIENHPTLELLNPQNVFFDPSVEDNLDDCMFIIQSFETNRAELIKAGVYKNLDKIDWKSSDPLSDPDHESNTPADYNANIEDTLRRKQVAYEYWGYWNINNDDKLVPIVATWINDTMIRLEENPFPDGKAPFVVIPYLTVPRSLYGEPDASLLEEHQKIIGAVTRGMVDLLAHSANSQQGFAKGMLDPMNRRRFELGENYEFNVGINPQQGYIMHTYPEFPQSALTMLQMMNNEAESLTGVKSFSGGISGDAYGQVAAGIQGVLDASSKREMDILYNLAEGMNDIGKKLIAYNSAFLSDEETIRITNKEFVTVNREDIKGNFDLRVDIYTPESQNAKANDIGFMLQTIGPNMPPDILMKTMGKIADLKDIPDLAQQFKTWQPQPDPIEEEKKQLENEKTKSEIALNNSRAQKESANAEGQNIDNALTVTGTKHQQEMEKQQAQAEGNMDLEIAKNMMAPVKQGEFKPNPDAAVGWKLSRKALQRAADNKFNPANQETMRLPNEQSRLNQANAQLANQATNPALDNPNNINYRPNWRA